MPLNNRLRPKTESEARVRAEFVSRRRFIKSSALDVAIGVAVVAATGIIALTTSQPARDFNAVSDHGISGGSRHAVSGGGEPQVFNLSMSARAGFPRATFRARVSSRRATRRQRQVLRV